MEQISQHICTEAPNGMYGSQSHPAGEDSRVTRSPVSQSVFQEQPDPTGVALEQEEGIKELSPESDPTKPISGTDVQLQRV